jgi:gluconokinase
MHAGRPLDDAERAPWLVRVHDAVAQVGDGPVVLACSALKRDYRDVLRGGVAELTFVELEVDARTLARRLEERPAHFAGPELLSSQLATLELGDDVVRVDGTGTPAEVVDRVLRAVARPQERPEESDESPGWSTG